MTAKCENVLELVRFKQIWIQQTFGGEVPSIRSEVLKKYWFISCRICVAEKSWKKCPSY